MSSSAPPEPVERHDGPREGLPPHQAVPVSGQLSRRLESTAGNVAWIVTGNVRDIAAGELVFDGFRVVTPGAWLKEES